MYSRVICGAIYGVEARRVSVEADVSEGMPLFAMVGYLSSEVREAQDRVRTAIKSIGENLPVKRITVNLSPADLRKEGSGFDLPIAVAVLMSAGALPAGCAEGILMVGELGLNGQLRPVRGVLQIAAAALSFGCQACIVPEENLAEGSAISGVKVLGAGSLKEVTDYLQGKGELKRRETDIEKIRQKQRAQRQPDFADIRGQSALRRAAEIAVAGFHNLLIIGPPGAGKSMTAKRIPSILPEPTREEILEITRIHSVAGMLPPEGIWTRRPFRSPHHSISASAMAGGGKVPKPGEISLAHRGVLFLDELPEFAQSTLELLRQPMEDGQITICRVSGTSCYPARFILVGACNPCKCGYWPDRDRCRCSPGEVRRYLEHISQPLLDRMDLCVEAREPVFADLMGEGGESSADIRSRVEKAAALQAERYRGIGCQFNGELPLKAAERFCRLGREEKEIMGQIYRKLSLTGRSYLKILRVARTLADLEGAERVAAAHLLEAASYRTPDRSYWGGDGG